MGDIIEVRSLRVKTPYQPVGMLIQPAFPGMIWPGKVDRCPRDLSSFKNIQSSFKNQQVVKIIVFHTPTAKKNPFNLFNLYITNLLTGFHPIEPVDNFSSGKPAKRQILLLPDKIPCAHLKHQCERGSISIWCSSASSLWLFVPRRSAPVVRLSQRLRRAVGFKERVFFGFQTRCSSLKAIFDERGMKNPIGRLNSAKRLLESFIGCSSGFTLFIDGKQQGNPR